MIRSRICVQIWKTYEENPYPEPPDESWNHSPMHLLIRSSDHHHHPQRYQLCKSFWYNARLIRTRSSLSSGRAYNHGFLQSARPHLPLTLLEANGLATRPGQLVVPTLGQAVKLKCDLTLSPHWYIVVAMSTVHMLSVCCQPIRILKQLSMYIHVVWTMV
jgi:hypothetical protein